MAKPKLTMTSAMKHSVKGWGAVFSGGILLTLLALADAPADCQLRVLAEQLPVRSEPRDASTTVQTLPKDTVVDGTPEVTNSYRRLEGGGWAANEFLVLVEGTTC